MFRSLLTVVVCLLLASALRAQMTEGGISGAVKDSSGAAFPGAVVTVKNAQTGETREAATDSVGFYHVGYLRPGEYEVRASRVGFQTSVVTGIQVAANNVTRADVVLNLGTVRDTVEVRSEAGAVNTEEARLTSTMTTRQVQELPLNGRDIYQLVLLQPGVTATMAPVISNTQFDTFNYGFSANGAPPRGNNYVADGISNNNEWLGGTPAISPSVDSVQEFQVQTVNFSPEFGRSSGSVVTVVTRSGTNNFHGSLYDYLRNPLFDSRNEFDTATSKERLIQNQFGGSIGGPIRHDRTFFFFNYEGLRARDGLTQIVEAETPEFRQQVALYRSNSIANQQLQKYAAPPCIPGTSQDTGSIYLAAQPLSTVSLTPGLATLTGPKDGIPDICQVAFFSDRPITGNQYLFRGDQQFSVKDRMFLRVMADDRVTDSAREQLGAAAIRGFKAPFNGFFPSLLLGETHLFSSRFLNDFRMSYARSDFGIAFQVPGQQGGGGYPTLGGFASGVASFGGASLVPRNFVFNDFTWNDSFAATVGRHTVKVGFEVSRVQENSDYKDISYGSYSFTNIFTFANDAPYSTTGLVNPATGQFTSTPRHFRSTEYGAFVQDDWKVTRRLTANLGLRYDYFGSPTETQGILSNIVMGHGSSLAQDVATATVGRVSTLFNASPHNFAPRLGLAFDPAGDGKTSLRASYSMAYLAPYSNLYTNASRFDPPDSAFPLVYPALYGGTISYGVPAIPSPGFLTGLTSSGSIPGTRISVSGVAQNLKTAYSEQWFFGVQRKLPGAFYLSANYVGTAGHQLYIRNDINRFTGDRPSLTVGVVRYNQSWNGTTFVENGSDSIYHGINAQLQKRFGHSSTFTVNYTFGKSIDTVSDPGLGDYSNVAVGIYNGTMDVSKAFLDHGASDFDVRHRLTTNGVWDLPSPKSASWLRTVIGGWQLNGLATFQTGRPFSVVCNSANLCDYNGDGDGYDRPNTPAFGNTLTGLSRSNYIKGLFTVSQFPVPVFGTDGNLGRNTFRGPGFAQVDSSLFKKIPIHEKITLQFRAEVFNVFNRVNLYLPNDSLVSALFGRSTAAFQPRQMQFALKLVF